ncbi:MAG: hypothetical protein QOF10_3884, partial [Kribbellaceae bacterium]|nr:hypothetical protein [Kribbellaceae bacterium]
MGDEAKLRHPHSPDEHTLGLGAR